MDDEYRRRRRRARRHERKRQHLGSPTPTCLSCGCTDIEDLIAVPISKLPRWFLEEHHLAGRAASNFTVTLCRNCHAILTDWQEDWDERLRRPRTPVERLAAFLQGLANWSQLQARKQNDLAAEHEAWARWLLGGMEDDPPD